MATTTTQRRTLGEPTLAARLRSGDPTAFEDLYLLTELPSSIPPLRLGYLR